MVRDQPADTTAFRRRYAEATGDDRDLPAFAFGDSKVMADELAALVTGDRKRATAGLLAEYEHDGDPVPEPGDRSIILDGDGEAAGVIETLDVRVGPLGSVDPAFAWDEGEGDRTTEDWLDGHRRFFARRCALLGLDPSDDLPVVFERFGLAWPPAPPEPPLAATPDPTLAATPDPTLAATPDPTLAATPDPTLAATPDPTLAATPDPTLAATPAADAGAVVRELRWDERQWAAAVVTDRWSGPLVVARGAVHDAGLLPGLVAERGGRRVGLATFRPWPGGEAELVTLDALEAGQGHGRLLLTAFEALGRREGWRRLVVATTNDNTVALRAYQLEGWDLVALRRDAIGAARRLKPAIPERGLDGIPLRHELELERRLD